MTLGTGSQERKDCAKVLWWVDWASRVPPRMTSICSHLPGEENAYMSQTPILFMAWGLQPLPPASPHLSPVATDQDSTLP